MGTPEDYLVFIPLTPLFGQKGREDSLGWGRRSKWLLLLVH